MNRLSWYQRVANRLGRPWGVMPFADADRPPDWGLADDNELFDTIYAKQYWGSSESGSGTGSELWRTERYRRELANFLDDEGISSIFDAPCGDLNWIRLILRERPIRYVGGDISAQALEKARVHWPGCDVRLFDLRTDPFPQADVWHCRDTLFHLSFADIWKVLENASRSDCRLALLTTHRGLWLRNLDIETGGWRRLDLERRPFNLPRARHYLADSVPGEFPRFVGVWTMDDLRTAVSKRA